jgi:subtilisin-like proprotein convertase family protein
MAIAALGLLVVAAPASAKTKTAVFNRCVSTAIEIPDGPPVDSTEPSPAASFAIAVGVPKFKGKRQSGVIRSFNAAGVRISHTDDGDLSFFLVSPGGRAVALATNRDGSDDDSGNGYGTGEASCGGSLVQFGDAFSTSITRPDNTGDDAPITGSFRPEQALSTFAGGPARGLWTLVVQDAIGGDVGQINALSLNVTYTYKARAKRKR